MVCMRSRPSRVTDHSVSCRDDTGGICWSGRWRKTSGLHADLPGCSGGRCYSFQNIFVHQVTSVQSGFTAVWIGRAKVNPDLFLAYQRGWKNNQVVPAYLREHMRLDAEPARDVGDDRVKAAFAMAPGDIQGFGMDEAGLRQMAISAYIIVGAGDTATPPKENAEFAAKYIPHAQLDVLPGQVSHEIFGNECDQVGRDNYPDACIDAPGVDRAKLNDYIGKAALKFFDTNLNVQREKPH
jgi:hypothetical protein